MELVRRSAVIVLVIAAMVAAGLAWRTWTRESATFTVADNQTGWAHAKRRCAKRGLVHEVLNDSRPGYLMFRCVKPS